MALSTALERARGFHTNWSDLLNRLNEAEEAALVEWTPCGLPETCQADIDGHRSVIDKAGSLQSAITALREEGEGLKAQGSQEDKELVERWLEDVEQRYEEVVANNQRKQVWITSTYSSYILWV